MRFASKAEATRYVALKCAEQAGEIRNLRLQVKYPLHVAGVTIGSYIADFNYDLQGREVVEDVKGFRTPLYKWKKKHVEAEYGIQILET